MKQFRWFLLVMIGVLIGWFCFGGIAGAGQPVDADQLMGMLGDSLAIAKGLPGVVGAIFVGLVSLAASILLIAKYFLERGAREKAAYEADLATRKVQAENLSRMQADSVKALLENDELSYKQDYEFFIKRIVEKKYDLIYLKVASKFHAAIALFVYDETLTPEQRAAKIIFTIRPQS